MLGFAGQVQSLAKELAYASGSLAIAYLAMQYALGPA